MKDLRKAWASWRRRPSISPVEFLTTRDREHSIYDRMHIGRVLLLVPEDPRAEDVRNEERAWFRLGRIAVTMGDAVTRVALAPEDLARVRRLTEEVEARLYEVGLIMGRTVGHDSAPGTVVKYERQQSQDDPSTSVEVVVIALPDGTFCCMQDPPGESVCPC